MKRFITSLFFVFTFLASQAQTPLDIAPDFTVKDLESNTHNLYEYLDAGKYVVIDFFTTNCQSCQIFAPRFSDSYEYFGCNFSNVIHLGINYGGDNIDLANFNSQWGAIYPSASGISGGGNKVVNAFEVISFPTIILIAPDRTIVKKQLWNSSQSPEELLEGLNNAILEAGGIPLICTVDTEQIPAPEKEILSATHNSSGGVIITCHEEPTSGLDLLVYSADGRMVYNRPLTGNVTNISLRPGIYFAALLKNGSKISTLRFISN